MAKKILAFLEKETRNLEDAGLLRSEFVLGTAQSAAVSVGSRPVINLASSNYLGFSNHPELKKAAQQAIETFGVGLAAPRMIGGTQTLHQRLERSISCFLKKEDTLLFASCYHANTGLFESLIGERDQVFCDAACHPSIADGLRLCRARVLLYRSRDINHLEDRLRRSRAARFRVVVTDAVFPLDGTLSDLEGICGLAEKYNALVVVDESQAVGVMGARGRGAQEHFGLMSKVDVVTGTFSKALGGGSGGYVSGRRQVVEWLRQKSRPYMVSGALSPGSVGAGLKALEMLDADDEPLKRLRDNVGRFRASLTDLGFQVVESEHPIVAVLVGTAVSAQRVVDKLHGRGVYAVGFCYPVVPEGEARIRVQISAEHSPEILERVARAFEAVGGELKLI